MKNIARRPRLSLLTCRSIRFRLQARSPSEMSRDGETQPSLAIAPSASSFIRRELRQYRDGKSHSRAMVFSLPLTGRHGAAFLPCLERC
jgi:hypothetical protein